MVACSTGICEAVVLHALGARDAQLLGAHDARRVVLQDGRNGQKRRVGRVGEHVGDVVLEAYAQLRLAGAHDRLGGVLGGLDDLELDALAGVVALVLCHVDARMIGVGRPVQAERELGGAARRGGRLRGTLCGAARKGGGRGR